MAGRGKRGKKWGSWKMTLGMFADPAVRCGGKEREWTWFDNTEAKGGRCKVEHAKCDLSVTSVTFEMR